MNKILIIFIYFLVTLHLLQSSFGFHLASILVIANTPMSHRNQLAFIISILLQIKVDPILCSHLTKKKKKNNIIIL